MWADGRTGERASEAGEQTDGPAGGERTRKRARADVRTGGPTCAWEWPVAEKRSKKWNRRLGARTTEESRFEGGKD